MGFSGETLELLTEKITIDPSRGIGHASGPGLKSGKAHLRTRVGADGMDYKGYNVAIHELGHNVEQVLSLHRTPHASLRGVATTACTEAFAFAFQGRDLELLGLAQDDPLTDDYHTLEIFWNTFEIAGVSLVDMRAWQWLYENPDAPAAELKAAVREIAIDIWNEYFARIIGLNDSDILAVYSHMINYPLYLPSYALGHIISFQIGEYFKGKDLAVEMERMCATGSVTPDLWMHRAVGSPISAQALIDATEKALAVIK